MLGKLWFVLLLIFFMMGLQIHKERARHAALVLNLLAAQALLASGELTDAG